MKRPMIEYTKLILSKVSFDPNLFYRELKKAVNSLLHYEVEELKEWLNVYNKNKPELMQCVTLIEK